MSKNIEVTTIEELVSLAIRTAKYASRYSMFVCTDQEYNDVVAGDTWDKESDALYVRFNAIADKVNEPIREHNRHTVETGEPRKQTVWYSDLPGYQEEHDALMSRQPEKHQVTYYTLDAGRHGTDISLLGELGPMIVKTWKKGKGYNDFAGRVTLTGILKRLGVNGMEKQIEDAKHLAEESRAKSERNWKRKNLRDALQKMGDAIDAAQKVGLLSGIEPAEVKMGMFEIAIGDDEK